MTITTNKANSAARAVDDLCDAQVNTETAGVQDLAQAPALSSGGFVVVWNDGSGKDGDASVSAVKARIFGSVGHQRGNEVNSETRDDKVVPLRPTSVISTTATPANSITTMTARAAKEAVFCPAAQRSRSPRRGLPRGVRGGSRPHIPRGPLFIHASPG